MKKCSDEETRRVIFELLNAEQDLFLKIWDKLVPTLGEITLSAVFRHILKKVSQTYPLFSSIGVSEKGLDFKSMKEHLKKETITDIKEGGALIVSELILFLSEMTGDILVSDVKEIITKSKIKKKGE